jgi:cephalosporin hydroxylase
MNTRQYDANFELQVKNSINQIANDESLYKDGIRWLEKAWVKGYAYNFKWLGVPIIKLPADMIVLQEIVFSQKPTVIIETGIARCGSIIYFASLLKLINNGKVIGVDLDIRSHAKAAYEDFKNTLNISLFEGSSTDKKIIEQIKKEINSDDKVMVILDSDHRAKHVLDEISSYASIVTNGQYLCITDTFIEDLPVGYFNNIGAGLDDVGNSPVTAIKNWNYVSDGFELDINTSRKAVLTENRDGYFRKIR